VIWVCSVGTVFFRQYNFLFTSLKSILKTKTQHILTNVFNNVLNFIQQHKPNNKHGQKVIIFYTKWKRIRFYHSLKVQISHKYIFEIKSKEKLNKRKNMSFYKGYHWVFLSIELCDICLISVFLILWYLFWFDW